MESILTSIKKMLGITEEYKQFDTDIIIHINTVLMTLNQIGIGPIDGYAISSDLETWNDFVGSEHKGHVEAIKTYVYIKVKLVFDPPSGSSILEAFKNTANELEWRLNVQKELI